MLYQLTSYWRLTTVACRQGGAGFSLFFSRPCGIDPVTRKSPSRLRPVWSLPFPRSAGSLTSSRAVLQSSEGVKLSHWHTGVMVLVGHTPMTPKHGVLVHTQVYGRRV